MKDRQPTIAQRPRPRVSCGSSRRMSDEGAFECRHCGTKTRVDVHSGPRGSQNCRHRHWLRLQPTSATNEYRPPPTTHPGVKYVMGARRVGNLPGERGEHGGPPTPKTCRSRRGIWPVGTSPMRLRRCAAQGRSATEIGRVGGEGRHSTMGQRVSQRASVIGALVRGLPLLLFITCWS